MNHWEDYVDYYDTETQDYVFKKPGDFRAVASAEAKKSTDNARIQCMSNVRDDACPVRVVSNLNLQYKPMGEWRSVFAGWASTEPVAAYLFVGGVHDVSIVPLVLRDAHRCFNVPILFVPGDIELTSCDNMVHATSAQNAQTTDRRAAYDQRVQRAVDYIRNAISAMKRRDPALDIHVLHKCGHFINDTLILGVSLCPTVSRGMYDAVPGEPLGSYTSARFIGRGDFFDNVYMSDLEWLHGAIAHARSTRACRIVVASYGSPLMNTERPEGKTDLESRHTHIIEPLGFCVSDGRSKEEGDLNNAYNKIERLSFALDDFMASCNPDVWVCGNGDLPQTTNGPRSNTLVVQYPYSNVSDYVNRHKPESVTQAMQIMMHNVGVPGWLPRRK